MTVRLDTPTAPADASAHQFDWSRFAEKRVSQSHLSARSLVVTFFGDIVSVHGGWIWLGSLIEVMASMGITERLVRTSVFRLVKDDWLQVKKKGRRSYYAFTEKAQQVYLQAARRIYALDQPTPDNQWTLILPVAINNEKLLQEFKKQISWMGFNRLATGVWAHPGVADNKALSSLKEALAAIEVLDKVILFQSSQIARESMALLSRHVYQQWGMDSLAENWQGFVDAYQPLAVGLEQQSICLKGKGALAVRLLAVHEYRRILLKDYDLPKTMLPANWSGEQARNILSVIYQQLSPITEKYIADHLESVEGKLGRASEHFRYRFQSASD